MSDLLFVNFTDKDPAPAGPLATDGTGPSFSFGAPPKSDIYASPRVPKVLHDYTAPVVCKRIPRDSFQTLQVTASAAWRTQYDQAGLLLTLPTKSNPNPDAHNAGVAADHPAWVKAGIEVNDGCPCVSIVARGPGGTGGWSDWSLIPLSLAGESLGGELPVSLQFTREKHALQVWLLRGDKRLFIRKVPWVFLAHDTLGDDVLVGAYAAQPDPYDVSKGESLQVTFSGFKIETA
ncbi:uncharacterized protein SPSK_05563 [Sporothrix schenckii 1099-18]|uniref:Uncharacterized protein n=2 Tax=Sporothrix schenckii TaxID=29908 RepID=U7Q3H5_SPOS1|nr:uncharacterized protein SPSK_05563 [Sporothrix schenckii 1099-18]ERT02414.1 hypothetical protein HMPREF1624_00712 [Sporothrix schenckii ATCC 58251]KJR80316.1 hypothetical protein SPSK_05563 [Sporothrix schenckii 1099-18]